MYCFCACVFIYQNSLRFNLLKLKHQNADIANSHHSADTTVHHEHHSHHSANILVSVITVQWAENVKSFSTSTIRIQLVYADRPCWQCTAVTPDCYSSHSLVVCCTMPSDACCRFGAQTSPYCKPTYTSRTSPCGIPLEYDLSASQRTPIECHLTISQHTPLEHNIAAIQNTAVEYVHRIK